MKLGCGQSEDSSTRVSRAAGVKESEDDPVNTRSAWKENAFAALSPSITEAASSSFA